MSEPGRAPNPRPNPAHLPDGQRPPLGDGKPALALIDEGARKPEAPSARTGLSRAPGRGFTAATIASATLLEAALAEQHIAGNITETAGLHQFLDTRQHPLAVTTVNHREQIARPYRQTSWPPITTGSRKQNRELLTDVAHPLVRNVPDHHGIGAIAPAHGAGPRRRNALITPRFCNIQKRAITSPSVMPRRTPSSAKGLGTSGRPSSTACRSARSRASHCAGMAAWLSAPFECESQVDEIVFEHRQWVERRQPGGSSDVRHPVNHRSVAVNLQSTGCTRFAHSNCD